MRKEYNHPEMSVIQLKAEQSILAGSVFGNTAPVSDAEEGDTNDWGFWL